jgi:raffinose/stachyose/melibiose transport system permease protein
MVPSVYSYSQFFQTEQVGYGATISTALTILIVIITFFFIKAQNRAEHRES